MRGGGGRGGGGGAGGHKRPFLTPMPPDRSIIIIRTEFQ